MDTSKQTVGIIGVVLVLIVGGIIGFIALILILASMMFIGNDYDSPPMLAPLKDSEIRFFLGYEDVQHQLVNADSANYYFWDFYVTPKGMVIPFLNKRPVVGVQIAPRGAMSIYAPDEGTLTFDDTGGVWINNRNFQYYFHGFNPTVSNGGHVKKGDFIGYAGGLIDAARYMYIPSLQNVEYYSQYLYWASRHAYFPLLTPPDNKGKLPYRYSSGFGMRTHPVTGKPQTMHEGTDIAIPSNSPVLAVEAGTIEDTKSARDGNAGGNRIYLVSEDGLRKYAFMHLSAFLVRPGDQVRKGQRIGLSGNTGRSTGPHLHLGFFDIKHNKYIDPQPAVKYWEKNMNWEALTGRVPGPDFIGPIPPAPSYEYSELNGGD